MPDKEQSPRTLFLIATGLLLATEAMIMWLLQLFPIVSPEKEAVTDAALLFLASLPILYFCMYRPLTTLLSKLHRQKEDLRRHRDHLEEEIQHRTATIEKEVRRRRSAEEDLKQRVCLSNLQASVTQALISNQPLDLTLQECAELINTETEAAFTRIWRLNTDNVLQLVASAGIYTHLDGGHTTSKIDEDKIGRIAAARRPLVTNDVQNDPNIHDPDWARREGVLAFAGYPLLLGDRLTGVIGLFARHPLDDLTIEMLAVCAEELALGITNRQQDEIIRQQAELHQAVTDSISEALLILDQGKVVFWNPAAELLTGHQEAEAIGAKLIDLLSPEPHRDDTEAVANVLSGAESACCLAELAIRRKDGSTRTVDCSFMPLADRHGALTLVVMHDISKRKKSDQERHELQRQLRQAQKMEAIGTLAGGIAHDFNNILAAILGYADLALAEVDTTSELHEDLTHIRTAGNRARELVRQILTFSRQAEREIMPVQPHLIAKEIAKLLRASLPASISIRQNIDPASGFVTADPTHIHQILLNLCTNAKHAMGNEGGTLGISLVRHTVTENEAASHPDLDIGDHILLTVSDTGCGMPPEIRERIFEPYFTTKAVGEGTGMGLAMTHGIVAGMKGAILVDSVVGKGTTFRVYMPAINEDTMSANIGLRDESLEPGSGRILLIDDEAPLVRMGKRMLEKLGYTATTRTSSIEALELFKARPNDFDMVITDYTMPNMNGLDMAAQMKKIRPDLVIILMTGFSESVTEEQALRRGVAAFVLKPIIASDMSRLIRKLLPGQKPTP